MKLATKILLYPISKLYQWAISIRNLLYDTNTLSSKKACIPTIGIGNITVGGTGKTPHSEYIIEALKSSLNIAYLSRGYKRSTKGYKDATKNASAKKLGDEAFQIHSKYPNITVAVCENRIKGIEQIKNLYPETKIVILDDIYQHRQITPDLNILLINYNRLIYSDHMIPLGKLRENAKNTDRADIIIITKCPTDMQPVDCMSIRSQITPSPYQKLLFSKITYKELIPIYDTDKNLIPNNKNIIAVSGIANSQEYIKHLKTISKNLINIKFNDHHAYSHKDINRINSELQKCNVEESIVIITEKDKAKFDAINLPESIKQRIFCLGIKIEFIFDSKREFDKSINKLADNIKTKV